MPPLGPLRYSRSILRGYVSELERLGILGRVRARASPALEILLSAPARADKWIDARLFHEMMAATFALCGRDAVRGLGYRVMRAELGAVLEPIIGLALSVLGRNPASLFSHAGQMAGVVSQGAEVTWAKGVDGTGTLQIRVEDPQPPLSWAPWEGVFVRALELAGHEGKVGETRAARDGRSATIEVSWVVR